MTKIKPGDNRMINNDPLPPTNVEFKLEKCFAMVEGNYLLEIFTLIFKTMFVNHNCLILFT